MVPNFVHYIARLALQYKCSSASPGGPTLAEIGQFGSIPDQLWSNLGELGPESAESGQLWSTQGQYWQMPGTSWSKSFETGQFWSIPSKCWSKLVDFGPNLDNCRPKSVELGRNSPEVGPTLVDSGPALVDSGRLCSILIDLRPEFARIRPASAKFDLGSANLGRFRPELARFGRIIRESLAGARRGHRAPRADLHRGRRGGLAKLGIT